jgi:glutamine synthetase
MAGIDGVRNRIQPPAPVDEDIYQLAGTERGRSIESTPDSLEEALVALERDHEFLLYGDVFTSDVIEAWIETKRRNEIDFIRLRPHPGEFSLYFNV